MKTCSMSYVVRDMHIKTTMKYDYTPIRINESKTTDNIKCWQQFGAKNLFFHCKIMQPVWKIFWWVVTTLNIVLTKVPIIGIHTNELKIYVHTTMCTQLFTANLLIIAKT